MERKMEERIDLYCQIYERAYERASNLFCDAGGVALRIFGEVTRDLRDGNAIQQSNEGSHTNKKQEENLATKRQREALHKFGVKRIPEDLSKKQASEILDRLISFSKEYDSASITKIVEELNQRWMEKKIQQRKK